MTEAGAIAEVSDCYVLSVTGSTPEAAKQALEACNWNLEMAVTMQIDYGEPVDPVILPNSSSLPSTSSHR